MDMRSSPAQERLRAHVAQLLAREIPAAAQAERAPGSDDAAGGEQRYAATWRALAAHDIVRLALPEPAGGMGLGMSEAIIVLEELGKALVESPYPDALAAADMIARMDAQGAHRATLGAIARGDCAVALALGAHGLNNTPIHERAALALDQDGAGWTLSGRVDFVPFARYVDHFAILARSAAGPLLLLAPRAGPGVGIRRHDEIGRGEYASVTFDRTPLAPRDAVGAAEDWAASGAQIIAVARARHAAYLLGMARRALDLTLGYTRERQQFGQRVASFQSIAFRLAALATRLEAARLLVQQTAWRHDRRIDIRRQAAGLLALASDLVRDVTAEALQMHGAFGLTETAEIQRIYRRAVRDALAFGVPQQLRLEAAALLAEEPA